ncbi:19771_t:CDS:2 [Dentiscutata erythropus]|uniref:19771_t:CDS:1 n=1 Tax=Dentiscutata erythropus TaxID=1348616 RepID=A0A9N9CHK8_9GLOM|nr:19771_t:CDS:2 [Dentiscutata erythropus]
MIFSKLHDYPEAPPFAGVKERMFPSMAINHSALASSFLAARE